MKDWKFIVIGASLAFILSLLFGLLGGVSFGALFLRAVSGSVIFGAMAFGASILMRRYLPELYELRAGSSMEINEDPGEVEGNQIEYKESESSSIAGSQIDISIDDGDDNTISSVKPEIDSDSALSKEEEHTLVDEIPEDNQVPENIDVLPDIGAFSNSFEGEVDDINDGASKAGAVTLDIMGEEQDPELVVRAVRTMVKKDQEG